MMTGVLARTALTGALYRRAVHLTPAARLRLPNSAVLNHVSTDVSRVDARAVVPWRRMLIERNLNSDGLFDYSAGEGAFACSLPSFLPSPSCAA
jgi:hypothetical protein